MDIESTLEQAASATLQGNKARARSILAGLVMREPRNELAWLMLAEVVWKKEHAIDCLERVLRLNPNNEQARRKLEVLKQGPSPQAQQGASRPVPQPVQPPPPQSKHEVVQPQSTLVSPPASAPIQNQARHAKPFEMTWAFIGVLSLLACGLFFGIGVLVWQTRNVLFPVPETSDSQTSPLPALAYPTQSTSSTGLGVTRARIQSTFEKFGFKFERSSDIGGQPVVSGISPSGTATVELIGPPDSLSQADIVVTMTSDPTINGVYMAALMEIAAPDWKGGNDWLSASVSDMPRVKEARATHGNVQATLSYIEAFGVLTLTIEAIDR